MVWKPGEVGSRVSSLSSHKLTLKSVARRSTARGDPELAVDGTQVRVDGMQAQHQLLGNLGIGQSCSEQAQHFHFAGSQAIGIGYCRLCCWSQCCWEWLKQRDVSLGDDLRKLHRTPRFPGCCKRRFVQVGADALHRALILSATQRR